jgi:hypothetical protein
MGGGLWDRIPWWFVVGVAVLLLIGAYFGVQALGYPPQAYLIFLGVVALGGVVGLVNALSA